MSRPSLPHQWIHRSVQFQRSLPVWLSCHLQVQYWFHSLGKCFKVLGHFSKQIKLKINFRHCTADGSWVGSPPSCNPISCGNPPAVVNGLVELVNGSTNWQAVASYNCLPSFSNYGNGQFNISSFNTFK